MSGKYQGHVKLLTYEFFFSQFLHAREFSMRVYFNLSEFLSKNLTHLFFSCIFFCDTNGCNAQEFLTALTHISLYIHFILKWICIKFYLNAQVELHAKFNGREFQSLMSYFYERGFTAHVFKYNFMCTCFNVLGLSALKKIHRF